MSYRELEVWQPARELVIDIHKMTLTGLPKSEMLEEKRLYRFAEQISAAGLSMSNNISEGSGSLR